MGTRAMAESGLGSLPGIGSKARGEAGERSDLGYRAIAYVAGMTIIVC